MTKGYSVITVKESVRNELKAFAEATHRTIPEVIEYLIEKEEKGAK